MLKLIKIIAIATFIITIMVLSNYKVAYQVNYLGQTVGYVANKTELETKIQKMINEKENNIAYINVEEIPKYQLMLVDNQTNFEDETILEKVKENSTITYHLYAVTLNGEDKTIVNTLEEAEQIVNNMKKEYADKTQFTIGIHEIYTDNIEQYEPSTVKMAEKEVEKTLQEMKSASVNGIYLAVKPVSGTITSRFGSREDIRTYAHTGLDIAANYGTDIKSATSGTVKWSGYMGSYGNLVIIDCGNNVEIYYGHASELYVKEGDTVKPGDVIAAVGSTGNSTGNHLHFEIRVNGSQVDPQNYIYQ